MKLCRLAFTWISIARKTTSVNILLLCIAICLIGNAVALPASAQSASTNQFRPTTQVQDEAQREQYEVIQLLNYIVVSLSLIVNYDDPFVLEQEYNNIINNINLNSVPDRNLILLIQSLMDLLTESRISDTDRAIIKQIYDENVNRAIINTARAGWSKVGSGFSYTYNGDPLIAISDGLFWAGTMYFDYRDQMARYRSVLRDRQWEIDKSVLRDINRFRTDFVRIAWELMNVYDIPDSWRLAEAQVERYIDILSIADVERRHALLKREEDYHLMYPPYWYYRGRAAIEVKDYEDAAYSFNYFKKIHTSIYRRDPFLASVLKVSVRLYGSNYNKDKIVESLNIMLENTDIADWTNYLFAALKYADMKEYEHANELVFWLLNNEHYSAFSAKVVKVEFIEKLLKNASPDDLARMVRGFLRSDTVNNHDLLVFYSNTQKNEILDLMAGEFSNIGVTPANRISKTIIGEFTLRKGGIFIFLSPRWVYDGMCVRIEIQSNDSKSTYINDEFVPVLVGESEGVNMLIYHVDNIIDLAHLHNYNNGNIKLEFGVEAIIDGDSYYLYMRPEKVFNFKIEELEAGDTWWDFTKIMARSFVAGGTFGVSELIAYGASSVIDDLPASIYDRLIFVNDNVHILGDEYEWGEDGIIIP